MAPWALLLLLAEALPDARPTIVGRSVVVMAAGAVLVGVSIFQAEFDFGVPRFQIVYLPVLVAAMAGFTLVLARLALGAWGAVKTLFYLADRGAIALIVAGSLDHTFPRFPCVWPPAWRSRRRHSWPGRGTGFALPGSPACSWARWGWWASSAGSPSPVTDRCPRVW